MTDWGCGCHDTLRMVGVMTPDASRSLDHLYDVNLWDVPLAELKDMARRLEARGSTPETRPHIARVRRNITVRELGWFERDRRSRMMRRREREARVS